MSVRMIQARLDDQGCRSMLEEEQALREITQEVVLAALGRSDFFLQAGFQGGTCLRLVHGLPRFSEDLDFALKQPDPGFQLEGYLRLLACELTAYGYHFEIDDRSRADHPVRQAFLKDDSLGRVLRLAYRPRTGPLRRLRIKLEVDTHPPAGANHEIRYLEFPYLSAMCVMDLPSLFAGKLHALLCRVYLKGRDWYDLTWYIARRTPINHELLSAALRQQGPWQGQPVHTDRDWCVQQLQARVATIDWPKLSDDVRRFVKPTELPSLQLWSRELFAGLCEKLV